MEPESLLLCTDVIPPEMHDHPRYQREWKSRAEHVHNSLDLRCLPKIEVNIGNAGKPQIWSVCCDLEYQSRMNRLSMTTRDSGQTRSSLAVNTVLLGTLTDLDSFQNFFRDFED